MSEERAVIYVTTGLHTTRIVRSNKPYVVVDKATLIVLDSDDKTLIGKEWKPPEYSKPTTSSGSIPRPPLFMEFALWLGRALFTHDTMYMTMPAGFKISVDIEPERDKVQYHWAMTFGDLVEPDVVITHEAPAMKLHEDPLYYSIVRHVYPLALRIVRGSPHRCTIENKTASPQTVEVTFWYIECMKIQAELIDNIIKAWVYHYLSGLLGAEEAKRLLERGAPII